MGLGDWVVGCFLRRPPTAPRLPPRGDPTSPLRLRSSVPPPPPLLRYDPQVRGRAARPSGLVREPAVTWEELLQELRVPFHLIREEKEGSVRVPARARGDHIVARELRQMMLDRRVVELQRARDLVRVQGALVLEKFQDPAPIVATSRSCEQVH